MLRLIFVFLIIIAGTYFAAQSAFYGLLFYLWNAYFRPDDWTYFGVIRSLSLSWIIGAYVVFRAILQLPNPRLGLRTLLILLFLVQAAICTYTSEHPYTSWYFLEDFFKVLLITYLIVVLVCTRRQFRLVLVVIAMSLGFEAAKQGWANLFLAPGAPNTNPIVFLGDNNGVAMGMMMLLPLLGALAQTATIRGEKFVHRFVAIGAFMRGITTYSRGGFLGAAALGLIAFIRAEKKWRALIGIVVLGGLVLTVMPQAFWDRMDTIYVEDEEARDTSATGRLHFWRVGALMAEANPLTGVGLNGYNWSYASYNDDERFEGVRAAHSIWFGVLGDLGYPGLILFAANLGFALLSCWQVGRMAGKDPRYRELRIYGNALFSALVVYAVSGSFLSQQYSEMAWHLFGLSTALLYVTSDEIQAAADSTAAKQAA